MAPRDVPASDQINYRGTVTSVDDPHADSRRNTYAGTRPVDFDDDPCSISEPITSRMRDDDFERYSSGPSEHARIGAQRMLNDSRLLLLSGYSPRRAHVALPNLEAIVDGALSQLTRHDASTRIEGLRACSLAVGGAIAAAGSALDTVDPLISLQLLAVEIMFVDVADEMQRRIGSAP